MIVITCLDQKNGMMFNHRRQSQDSVLREHVAKLVANLPLWMNHYSASQMLRLHHLRSGSRESPFLDGIAPIPLTGISICSWDLANGIWLARLSLRGILTT